MSQVKQYVLIDSLETLLHVKQQNLACADAEIITLTRLATLQCQQQNIPCRMIEDFSTIDELVQVSRVKYDELLEFNNKYDTLIKKYLPDCESFHLKPFQFLFNPFKMLMDTFATKVFFIKNFLKNENPSSVVYRTDVAPVLYSETLAFDENVSLYGVILDSVFFDAYSKILQPFQITKKMQPLKQVSLREILNRLWVRKHIFKKKLYIYFCRKAEFYPLLTEGYDIPHIIPLLMRHGIYPEYLPNYRSQDQSVHVLWQKQARLFWDFLKRDKEFLDFFSISGVNYFSALASTLECWVTNLIPQALQVYLCTRSYLEKKPRKRHFTLGYCIFEGLLIRASLQACKDMGLSLVTYQEGAGFGGVDAPMYDYTEVRDGDYFLSYGNGNGEYYKNRNILTKEFIPVGSAHLDVVQKKYDSFAQNSLTSQGRVRNIMYISTSVAENTIHTPNNGISANWYFKSQQKIFDMLASLDPSIQIKLKLHARDSEFQKLLQGDSRYLRFQFLTGLLENHLDQADLFLLDFPSTTLLNCCLTRARIFVLTEFGVTGLAEEQKKRLQKRAYLFHEVSTFLEAVKDVTRTPEHYPSLYSDEFLCAYGTHLNDGHSAERAVEFLRGRTGSKKIIDIEAVKS